MKKSSSECCDVFFCSGHILTKRGSSCSRKINRNNLSCNTLLEMKFLTSAGWVRLSPTEGTVTGADLSWPSGAYYSHADPAGTLQSTTDAYLFANPPAAPPAFLALKVEVTSVISVTAGGVGRCCTGAASPAAGEGNKLCFSVVADPALLAWWSEKGGRSTWVQSLKGIVWKHHKGSCSASGQYPWLPAVSHCSFGGYVR